MKTPVTAGALCLALAACSHHAPIATAPEPARATDRAASAPAPAPAAMSNADLVRGQVAGDSRPDSGGAWGVGGADSVALAARIRFDYDRAELSADDLAKLEAKRQVLTQHPGMKVRIAGNADERGPDEYNLALGLRRAAAAKRWLAFHGIAEDRISIVSYGEEQPLDQGHDENAWARNRRDDFLVLGTQP